MTNVETLPVKRELAAGAPIRAIVPTTMEDAYRIAVAVVKSGMAAKGMETPERCMIAIMQGMEVGLTPMQAIQRIAVIGNRPTIWGDAAIGLVRASGLCEYVREWIDGEGDQMVARCEAKRKGESEPIKGSFSVQDAVVAKLWKKEGPWQTHPKRMLQMRARGFVLRDGFADVLGGMYLREELEGEMVDVTPTPQPATARAPRTVEDMMAEFVAKNSKPREGEVLAPERKTKKKESAGGMRYDPALSAINLQAVLETLAEIEDASELTGYVDLTSGIVGRFTPEDQQKAEAALQARCKQLFDEAQVLSFFSLEDGEA